MIASVFEPQSYVWSPYALPTLVTAFLMLFLGASVTARRAAVAGGRALLRRDLLLLLLLRLARVRFSFVRRWMGKMLG